MRMQIWLDLSMYVGLNKKKKQQKQQLCLLTYDITELLTARDESMF